MSRTLLHDWECSIEKNKNNTEELFRIAEDIYNTAYARGKASTERPQGKWIYTDDGEWLDIKGTGTSIKMKNKCSKCGHYSLNKEEFCPTCGADMRGDPA